MSSIDFSKLDLAFLLDTTSSMSSYINHAKQNITKIFEELTKSEKCNLRMGLVNYRDHPPQDHTYITQVHEFTDDINKAKNSIKNTEASGGGDLPESVCCAFHDCIEKLEWRSDAVKVVVLIADAPPHGLGVSGDSMPMGCPLKNDPVEIAHKMAEKGITLYCAGCEPSLNPYRQFFIALCLITGGQYVSLNNVENLTNVIIGGAREEISMEKMMAQAHEKIMKEAAEKGTRVDEDELTKRVHEILNSKNNFGTLNKLENEIKITEPVKELAKLKNLQEIKKYSKDNNLNIANDYAASFVRPIKMLGKISSKPRVKHIVTKPKSIVKRNTRKTKKTSATRIVKILGELRRSLRIKEMEERRRINEGVSKDVKLVSVKTKRKLDNETDEENNKKLKVASDSTKECDEEEKVDITRARRMAKKVIARNKL